MFTKETPRWILAGGMTLAACAGCINAVGFLGEHHQAVTHLTGTITNLGMEIARSDRTLAVHAGKIIVCFFLGCVLSGVIIRHSTLRAGRRYGVALMLECGLLIAAARLIRIHAGAGDYLLAMAAGLQNAMASSYSGAVIRTTHVTGIITDLGIAIGLIARRESVDWRRLRLYGVLLGGFFAGSLLGAACYLRIGSDTLLIPAAVTGLSGVVHTVYRHYTRTAATAGAHR